MDVFGYLGLGFSAALTPENLLYAFAGAVLGTLVGVMPALGPTQAVALLLPITAGLAPLPAIIMLAGIYYGSMYGGSTTAILMNMPGEAASVPTTIDGYQMARQGRAGTALGIAAIGSFVAATISIVLLMFLARPLASFALSFGPAEYFSLMVLGLTIIVSLASKSIAKAVIAGALGMLVASAGIDPLSGQGRFTFGSPQLFGGIDLIAVVVGLFGIAEVLSNLESRAVQIYESKVRGIFPSWSDLRRCIGPTLRGSMIGFIFGVLPGAGAATGAFVAYDVEKKISREPQRFGRGAIEGVAAPESANNAAATGGGMVPLLAFGIPASPTLAVVLGAFLIHGLRPGPLLFQENPTFVWGLIASMYIGNVMLLVLNLPLVPLWAQVVRIPYPLLAAGILAVSFIGSYSSRNSLFDVWVALAFGLIGYLMRKTGVPVMVVIMAFILAPTIETSLRQALTISGGSLTILVTRPLSLALLVAAGVSLILAVVVRKRALRSEGLDRAILET